MRICNRNGCGRLLTTKTGAPDFRRHFCSRECKNADSKDRMVARRNSIHGRKCRLCGRAPRLTASVSRDTRVGQVIDGSLVTKPLEHPYVS